MRSAHDAIRSLLLPEYIGDWEDERVSGFLVLYGGKLCSSQLAGKGWTSRMCEGAAGLMIYMAHTSVCWNMSIVYDEDGMRKLLCVLIMKTTFCLTAAVTGSTCQCTCSISSQAADVAG